MRIVFFGTPEFAVPSLKALLESDEEVAAVVTQTDKRKGRDSTPTPAPIKKLALERGVRVLQPRNMREPEFLSELESLMPDLIVVVAYGKILPPRILTLPRRGCINVHASLLPKYRGAAPIQWALLEGEKKTGVTTMLMDEGLDTGAILFQEEVDISADDNAETLGRKLSVIGASVLMKTIGRIGEGSLLPIPQSGAASFAPPLKKGDGRIDWSKPAEQLRNFVRGMYPWPGAYCYLNHERIKITGVTVLDGSGEPGSIVNAEERLVVGTGRGLLSIVELQPEGRRIMTARAFLRGRKLCAGVSFNGQ
ncbi:MAG: methionyl-tRNA formyltransferase [Nitrospirota bacterium]